jgi:integrase
MAKFSFIIRKNRPVGKQFPIFGRISYTLPPKEFDTGVLIDNPDKNWNKQTKQIKGSTAAVQNSNKELNKISREIEDIIEALEQSKVKIDSDLIKKIYSKKTTIQEAIKGGINQGISLMDGYQIWIDWTRSSEGRKLFEESTTDLFVAYKKFTRGFLINKYKDENFPAKKVDQDFYDSLALYSPIEGKQVSGSYMKKILGTVTRVLKHLHTKRLMEEKIELESSISVKPSVPVYKHIPDDILVKFKALKFQTSLYQFAHDFAIFQSETGQAYIDAMKLQEAAIDLESKFIREIRIKTKRYNRKYIAPLSDLALEIIAKYKDHPLRTPGMVFPQKFLKKRNYNKMLWQIGKKLGYHLSPHMFRHYFGTKMINEGYSPASVAKMMGISVTMLEKVYAEVLDKRLMMEREMIEARKKS